MASILIFLTLALDIASKKERVLRRGDCMRRRGSSSKEGRNNKGEPALIKGTQWSLRSLHLHSKEHKEYMNGSKQN